MVWAAFGGSLKMDGTFNHLSKFVCLKLKKVNGPSVWSLGHISSLFLQPLGLMDSTGASYFRYRWPSPQTLHNRCSGLLHFIKCLNSD